MNKTMKTLSTLFTIAFFSLTANLFASAPKSRIR